MPMTFEEAEARFRQLQARVQRGEAISRADYEDQVSQLAVQDPNGVLWEINPRTGKWMYFDGAEWVSGAPPGHDSSLVIPASSAPVAPAPPPAFASQPPASKPPATPEAVQPYKRAVAGKPAPASKPPSGAPPQRPSRSGGAFAGREWVPLAIGAVVLLLCALVLFLGGRTIVDLVSPARTPTRLALPSPISSPLPTQVRLPSPTPIPPTPVPVVGKIIEAQANVRAQPNTRATILTRLRRDTQITLVAAGPTDAGNVWYQINLPDRAEPAWIRGDTFQIVSGDPKTLPLVGGATPAATKPPATGPTPTLTPIGVRP